MLTLALLEGHFGPAGRRRSASGAWYWGLVWVPRPGVAVWLVEGEVQVVREAAGKLAERVGVASSLEELDELVARASR